MWYAPLSNPDSREADLADLCARVVAAELKIEPPSIEFFAEHRFGSIQGPDGGRMLGESPYGGDKIRILSGLSPALLCRVVRHELFHCAQWKSDEWRFRSREIKESAARVFELDWFVPQGWDYQSVEEWLLRSVVDSFNARVKATMQPSSRLMDPRIEIR
jgi:hypothetical protein